MNKYLYLFILVNAIFCGFFTRFAGANLVPDESINDCSILPQFYAYLSLTDYVKKIPTSFLVGICIFNTVFKTYFFSFTAFTISLISRLRNQHPF